MYRPTKTGSNPKCKLVVVVPEEVELTEKELKAHKRSLRRRAKSKRQKR